MFNLEERREALRPLGFVSIATRSFSLQEMKGIKESGA